MSKICLLILRISNHFNLELTNINHALFSILAHPEEKDYPKIMFIGGSTQNSEWEEDRILVEEIDVYDICRDTWSVETKIPTPRYHSGVALVQGKLYVMGGFHSDQQLFDRATGNNHEFE